MGVWPETRIVSEDRLEGCRVDPVRRVLSTGHGSRVSDAPCARPTSNLQFAANAGPHLAEDLGGTGPFARMV